MGIYPTPLAKISFGSEPLLILGGKPLTAWGHFVTKIPLMPKTKPHTVFKRAFRLIFASISAILAIAASARAGERVPDETHAAVRAVMAVQQEVTSDLMQTAGVLGTAIGLNESSQPSLIVYLDRDNASVSDTVRSLPPRLRGVALRAHLTDKFVAYRRPPWAGGGGSGTTVSHTAKQSPPIQLGTSGGFRNDLANGYCCGGTLGSLVQVNGVQYIMSNYHVFESDIVSGGNGIIAQTGDGIIQPGLIDVGCNANNAQIVGTLLKVSSLPTSNVDVSVARVVSGMVSTDGSILEIGPLSSQTIAASLNQAVKKSGRTTGLSHSSISGLNATISVQYENECAAELRSSRPTRVRS
jgi:hypothetical protein